MWSASPKPRTAPSSAAGRSPTSAPSWPPGMAGRRGTATAGRRRRGCVGALVGALRGRHHGLHASSWPELPDTPLSAADLEPVLDRSGLPRRRRGRRQCRRDQHRGGRRPRRDRRLLRGRQASGCTSTPPTAAPLAGAGPSRRLFGGIERADSVTIDPHKWLFTPFDCAAVLYRDPARGPCCPPAARPLPRRGQRGRRRQPGRLRGPPDPARARRAAVGLAGGQRHRRLRRRRRALPGRRRRTPRSRSRRVPYLELATEPQLSVVLFRRRGWRVRRLCPVVRAGSRERHRRWSRRRASAANRPPAVLRQPAHDLRRRRPGPAKPASQGSSSVGNLSHGSLPTLRRAVGADRTTDEARWWTMRRSTASAEPGGRGLVAAPGRWPWLRRAVLVVDGGRQPARASRCRATRARPSWSRPWASSSRCWCCGWRWPRGCTARAVPRCCSSWRAVAAWSMGSMSVSAASLEAQTHFPAPGEWLFLLSYLGMAGYLLLDVDRRQREALGRLAGHLGHLWRHRLPGVAAARGTRSGSPRARAACRCCWRGLSAGGHRSSRWSCSARR